MVVVVVISMPEIRKFGGFVIMIFILSFLKVFWIIHTSLTTFIVFTLPFLLSVYTRVFMPCFISYV